VRGTPALLERTNPRNIANRVRALLAYEVGDVYTYDMAMATSCSLYWAGRGVGVGWG
jgi:hypothetical protein